MNSEKQRNKPKAHDVFPKLTMGERRILRILGLKGELNLVEIESELIKKRHRKDNFERWGIKNRLDGKGKFIGLIPLRFVSKKPVNKKETKYHLTFKGILAVANNIGFESIHQVKQFNDFLISKGCDEKIARLAIEFIEREVAVILTYHSRRQYDWTRSNKIERYWNDFKKYNITTVKQFFDFTDVKPRSALIKVHNEYLRLFFALDEVTKPINCIFNNSKAKVTIPSKDPIRNYIDRWYMIIEKVSLGEKFNYQPNDNTEEKILSSFFKECKNRKIEAKELIKRIR